MENRKRTNLISVLIILLCLSLCVGATYAYFTDSVTSTGNKIQAGNLKIDLELLDKEAGAWNSIKTSQAPIFNYNLWEPGYTDVKLLKVENEGNLAIKWEARLVTEGTLNALADEIEVYVTTSNDEMNFPTDLDAVKGWTKVGTLRTFFADTGIKGTLEATKASYFAIALHLPTTVENTNAQGVELQNLALPEFDIQIVATQYTYESDAFDHLYDCMHFETEIIEGRHPTYSLPGLTDGEKCTVCNKMIVEQEEFNYSEGLMYQFVSGDGENESYYIITGWGTCSDADVVVPQTFNDGTNGEWSVKVIGDNAFLRNSKIKSITIPNSVTTIGQDAFKFSKLSSITIPDSVTQIGLHAFMSCSELTSVTLGNGLTSISWGMFSSCVSLTSVTIGSGVTTIGEYAFDSCSSLTSITFEGTIEQWNAIKFLGDWNSQTLATEVVCSDGTVPLN